MSSTKIDLNINPSMARDILVDFIRTEIRRAGFERAVVGVSGGLDSSVTLLLTAQAMGPEQVLALSMPYRTSSQDSREHARLIAQQAGVRLEEVDISPMVDAFFERFPDAGRVRRGNVMARMRMIVLFDQSAAFKGLVVGTGNKTELLLGYTTLYGDSACALNPLGDLYKTQVRQLARFLEVPEEILNKPPSADLWDGQTDEGELGFTYEQVDRLLYLLVDQRYSPDDCVEAGFEHGFVEKVLDRIRRNQFKRLLPRIAKLSNRTVGYDFLYLRDWGT